MSSPTERSLALLRATGFMVAVVERWNPYAKIRQDLFGIVDILAVGKKTVGVQTTTASNAAARLAKMRASPATAKLKQAGWVLVVHGWKKPTKKQRKWTVVITEV